MIGLGLAIDFSLIMVSRFRSELRSAPLEQALDRTLQTAGRSVTFSGMTLALTMAVLSLFPIMIIRSVAVAIAIVAAVAVVTALFLLPTVFVFLHRHLDRWNLRARIPWLNRPGGQGWHRMIETVMRRPVATGAAALLVLVLLALPAVWMETSGTTVDVLPSETESRQAMQTLRDEFGPGEPTPLMIVAHSPTEGGIWEPDVQAGLLALHERLEADPRVDRVQVAREHDPESVPGLDALALAGDDRDEPRPDALSPNGSPRSGATAPRPSSWRTPLGRDERRDAAAHAGHPLGTRTPGRRALPPWRSSSAEHRRSTTTS